MKIGKRSYELKGIIKKNSENRSRKVVEDGFMKVIWDENQEV